MRRPFFIQDKLVVSATHAHLGGKMFTKILRYGTGLFYLIGGPLIHLYLVTQQRAIYAAVDDQGWVVYQRLWHWFVLPNLIPLVILLMGLEMMTGALMLSRRPHLAALGQLGGLLFNLALIPLWFSYGIPNLLLVLLHGWLLRWEYQREAARSSVELRPVHHGV